MTSQTMHSKCTSCGSENIRRSRARKGERTLSMIFLRPLRCNDCRARYWVPRIRTYLIASAVSISGLLIAYYTFTIIIMPDQKIVRSQKPDTWEEVMIDNAIAKLNSEAEYDLTPQYATGATIPKKTEVTANTNTQQTDNRQFTMQLYYEKAQKGDTNARYQLGLMHLNGNGAIQDFEEAVKWFKLAAEKNHTQAQYQLGIMYKAGFGVDINIEKSYMWLNLSAAAGSERAALERDRIMRSLSPEQLKQAQSASREWLQNLNEERL